MPQIDGSRVLKKILQQEIFSTSHPASGRGIKSEIFRFFSESIRNVKNLFKTEKAGIKKYPLIFSGSIPFCDESYQNGEK